MARKQTPVSALEVPGTNGGRIVKPYDGFDLDDLGHERRFFECLASEHLNILGTKLGLWVLDLSTSEVDPLYNEPTKRVYDGPYVIKAWVEYPPTTPEANEVGFSMDRAQSAWVPRFSLEEVGLPQPPKPGDIVQFWDTAYYNNGSVLEPQPPENSGMFFELTDVDEDGLLFDSSSFVGWTLALRRNTKFVPERKLKQET